MPSPFTPTKVGNYSPFEVMSALQKSVRRCHEEAALYWAVIMFDSGLAAHAFSRFRIMAVEDIGLAAPEVIGQVNTLRTVWKERKNEPDARLYYVMALLLLVRAPKSRIVDHALIANFDSTNGKRKIARDMRPIPEDSRGAVDDGKVEPPIPEDNTKQKLSVLLVELGDEARQINKYELRRREIPDHALDKHTSRGRAMGRGAQHFFDEGAVLVNEDPNLPDTYRDAALAACLRAEKEDV